MRKIKLSFNKNSKADILSVFFVATGILVVVGNGLGFTVSSNQIDSWAAVILQVLGGLGLVRNTSTGTSQSQQVNVSSENASNTIELAQKFANAAVSELSVNAGITKAERKKSGIQQVLANLAQTGLSLDPKIVAGIVERAYQLYKASGGTSLDVAETPIPDDEPEPDEGADTDE